MASGQVEASFIGDEEFDFDLPVSPDSPQIRDLECEEEDEVFFGPVGYRETCVAVNTENTAVKLHEEESVKPLSPLSSEQVVELFKEATAVAVMLRNSQGDISPSANTQKNFEQIRRRVFEVQSNDENANPSEVKKENIDELIYVTDGKIPSIDIDDVNERKKISGDKVSKEHSKNILAEKNDNKTGSKIASQKVAASKQKKTGIQKPSSLPKSKLPPTKKSKSFFDSDLLTEDISCSPSKNNKKKKSEMPILYSRQNSNVSDTSISEETKSSKLPAPGQSGLMAPGSFVGRRRRTSSTSSVSSTSSTSSLPANLNDTFVISRSSANNSGAPAIRSSSTSNTIKDTGSFGKPRTLITKSNLKPLGFTKPAFARHSESDRSKAKGKLQPMKAFQKPTGDNTKSTGLLKNQGCLTPKKSTGDIPRQGTPSRRRSNLVTPSSGVGTPSKTKNSLVVTSSKVKPRGFSETPVKRRESAAICPRAIRPKGEANMDTPGKENTKSAVPGNETPTGDKTTKPSTQQEVSNYTTPRTSVSATNPRKPQTGSCQKRRSFLPTPTRSGQRQARHSITGLIQPSSQSPVAFKLSPEEPKTKEDPETSVIREVHQNSAETSTSQVTEIPSHNTTFVMESKTDPVLSESSNSGDRTASWSSNSDATQLEGDASITESEDHKEEAQQAPLLCEVTPSCGKSEVLLSHVAAHASPLLMMLSPQEKPDPFSPGNISPNLPQEASIGCPTLVPTVLNVPVNDLMIHTTPVTKAETNLIELSDSPMINVLNKCNTKTLVDI